MMQGLKRSRWILLLSVALGCEPETPTSSDVLTLVVCPPDALDGSTCEPLVADGHAEATVRVCSSVTEDRRTNLKSTLTATRGRFTLPKDATIPTVAEVALGASRCAETKLIMPTEAGYLDVQAELGGHSQSKRLEVHAAPLGPLELSPSSFELTAGESTSLDIAVEENALLGTSVSVGTKVLVTLVPTPKDAHASAYPKAFFLDADGAGKFSLYTSPTVTQIIVTVTAQAPAVNGIDPADPASSTSTFEAYAVGDGGAGG